MLDKIFDFIDFILDLFKEDYPQWWKDGGGPPYIGA